MPYSQLVSYGPNQWQSCHQLPSYIVVCMLYHYYWWLYHVDSMIIWFMPCVKANLLPQPSQPDYAVQIATSHHSSPEAVYYCFVTVVHCDIFYYEFLLCYMIFSQSIVAYTELKIMVCHRSFSDSFWYMTEQIQFGRTYFTVHFQWGNH